MVDLYFAAQLEPDEIRKIASDNGFDDPYTIEQFIMDFELFAHIQDKIPDCAVKGGMAVPFHIHGKRMQRLSVDIDLLTSKPRSEVIKIMDELRKKFDGTITIPMHHIPKKPLKKILPLLTYYCRYDSNFSEEGEIKIEIFFGNAMDIKTKTTSPTDSVRGVRINHPIKIYDRWALIGDKLTTLPFKTVGISHHRQHYVPKHIYDIATLLGTASGPVPIQEIAHAFEKTVNNEISYDQIEKHSFDSVLKDLSSFPASLLILKNDRLHLNESYNGRMVSFTRSILGKTSYKESDHIMDMLLVDAFCMLMQKYFAKESSPKEISEHANNMITQQNKLIGMGEKMQMAERHKITARHGKNTRQGRIIKNIKPVQAYLYDQIVSMGRPNSGHKDDCSCWHCNTTVPR